MENMIIEQDIRVFYVTAESFPEGIKTSHEKLHAMVPFSTDRKYFGISRPEDNGKIVYRAATEEKEPGEAEKYHCDTLVLKKGNYIAVKLRDYMKDVTMIGRAFDGLLQHPGIDPQGYCVEWYTSMEDMICMVRLK